MLLCPDSKCRAPLGEDDRFCGECGLRIPPKSTSDPPRSAAPSQGNACQQPHFEPRIPPNKAAAIHAQSGSSSESVTSQASPWWRIGAIAIVIIGLANLAGLIYATGIFEELTGFSSLSEFTSFEELPSEDPPMQRQEEPLAPASSDEVSAPDSSPVVDSSANGTSRLALRKQSAMLSTLLRHFQKQYGAPLSDPLAIERMSEQATLAVAAMDSGKEYTVNLPFLVVDADNNPVHFEVTLRPQ